MEAITQQNAALVEQAAAASESLQQQAEVLRQAVAVFRTGEGEVRGVPGVEAATATPMASAALRLAPG
jgi:methyl-accepting chemotaxis protein